MIVKWLLNNLLSPELKKKLRKLLCEMSEIDQLTAISPVQLIVS